MLKGTKDVLLFPPEAADRLVNPNGIGEHIFSRRVVTNQDVNDVSGRCLQWR